MTAQKPRIRYYGCDMKWLGKFAGIMADLAEVEPRGRIADFPLVAIDAIRSRTEKIERIVSEACACEEVIVVIIIPRGVTSTLKNIAARADVPVHFVTRRERLNLVRGQMERIIAALPDQND
jgi:hypothetical protein